jgi:imidazole glycerol phosphate synthase subunit HisF
MVCGPRSIDEVPIDAIRSVSEAFALPTIAGGAVSTLEQVRQSLLVARADAVLLPLRFIDESGGIADVKRYLAAAGIVVRGVS